MPAAKSVIDIEAVVAVAIDAGKEILKIHQILENMS